MKWNNIDIQLPIIGEKVLLCIIHWKNQFPLSYEIYGAEIDCDNDNEIYFKNIDDIGAGCLTWSLDSLRNGGKAYWMSEADAQTILPSIKE